MNLATAEKRLEEITGAKRSAAYSALDCQKSRFKHLIEPDLETGVLRLSAEGIRKSQVDD